MDPEQAKTSVTAISGQMKAKWNALTDGDIEGIAGNKAQLVDKLQERYGYAKEQAEREADEFLRLHAQSPEPAIQTHAPTAQAVGTLFPPQRRAEALPMPAVAVQVPAVPTPAVRAAENPAAVGYLHSISIIVNPRVLRWIVPTLVVGLAVMIFLPWTGAYPAGYPAYTQNAFQTIWGGVSEYPLATESLGLAKPFDHVEKNPWMLFYVLLVVFAAVLVVAPLFIAASRIEKYPAIVETLWRHRLKLLGFCALASLVLLVVQLSMGFGLETAVSAKADQAFASETAAAQTPEDREKVNIQRAKTLNPFNFRHTLWLDLAVVFHALILFGATLELWIERRGRQPLPRIDALA